jgi:hypothetical protein
MKREDIGALHVTFEYDNRVKSQKVMRKAFAEVRGFGMYHYMTPDGRPRITGITEDLPEAHRELGKLRRILVEQQGREVTVPEDLLEGFRERRWRKARLAARGEVPLRTKGHHPEGAYLRNDGTIIPRNQG